MDESLVLLADLLCLPLHAFASLKKNARREDKRVTQSYCDIYLWHITLDAIPQKRIIFHAQNTISENQRTELKQLQRTDELMYAFFRYGLTIVTETTVDGNVSLQNEATAENRGIREGEDGEIRVGA